MSRPLREVAQVLADLVVHAFREDDELAMRAFGSNAALAVARELEIALRQRDPLPRIVTPCPSCGAQSLFIGEGGHLTCAVLGCQNPCVESVVSALKVRLASYTDALQRIESGDPTEFRGPLTERGMQQLARQALGGEVLF